MGLELLSAFGNTVERSFFASHFDLETFWKHRRVYLYGMLYFIVRPRACFHCEVFRVPKNVTLKTNKPPAMRVVEIALAYSIKPPML